MKPWQKYETNGYKAIKRCLPDGSFNYEGFTEVLNYAIKQSEIEESLMHKALYGRKWIAEWEKRKRDADRTVQIGPQKHTDG